MLFTESPGSHTFEVQDIPAIADVFRFKDQVTFFELVSHMTEKIRIIVTLIAMLEMVKNRIIAMRLADHEDDFIIYKVQGTTA